ncbi:MAG TPA: class I SAM-dependent methyltransferase [Candidatus Acidoferrum sp.]|nr:class I SAM-dependent methyltransferase [Candidatus Acidoferrum sp.]
MSARPPHPVLTDYYRRDADRRSFVITLFDATAGCYDRFCGVMSLGSGLWYRRRALEYLGLRPGMTLLDVATGTGLVARAAARILGDPRAVVGLDPSAGMLRQARQRVAGPLVQGQIEQLPFAGASFDVLTIGYALRHAADLDVAFRECLRVLKPGGQILVLEISRPTSPAQRWLTRLYITRAMPLLIALTTRNRDVGRLARYYWDTIATCVPPDLIVDSLRRSGFGKVRHRVLGGLLSEYTGERPTAA